MYASVVMQEKPVPSFACNDTSFVVDFLALIGCDKAGTLQTSVLAQIGLVLYDASKPPNRADPKMR